MDYVGYAKIIATKVLEAENAAKEKIRSKFRHRTIEDVRVLETMLDRCSKSSNSNLHADLKKHGIPERVKKVAEVVNGSHYHEWNEDQCSRGRFTFFQCIQEERDWNSTAVKGAILGSGVLFGIFMFAIPTIISSKMVYDMTSHGSEVEKQLTWVVEEIEALYNQTNTLMIANLV